jgi:AcrR family transcriptional regulator
VIQSLIEETLDRCFHCHVARVDSRTREQLLTVAERLLLESGYEAVSVRAVCAAAGVNPAAVHYHFGSKAGLVSALLEARLGPLWEEALRDKGSDESLDVAQAVWIVITPLVELAGDPAGRLYLNLLSRMLLARNELKLTQRWFSMAPWAQMLRRNVEGLSQDEASRRWMLAFELIFAQFGDPLAGDRQLSEHQVRTLHGFVTAGLSARAAAA